MVDHGVWMDASIGRIAVLSAVASRSFLGVEESFGERIVLDFQSRHLL